MCNQAWEDKTSENIPALCKIRYTVNRVVLLDISECIEVIVHMPVICVAW